MNLRDLDLQVLEVGEAVEYQSSHSSVDHSGLRAGDGVRLGRITGPSAHDSRCREAERLGVAGDVPARRISQRGLFYRLFRSEYQGT